jgi:hypothetical protein
MIGKLHPEAICKLSGLGILVVRQKGLWIFTQLR